LYPNKVEICGVDTSKLKVLSEKEKRALLLRTHNGDKAAREELISGNLRLVLAAVQRFATRADSMDDIFQVGCIGLMKAIDHFDINQPVRLSTYAFPMIIGEIRRFLRDNNAVRVSRSVKDTAYRAMQAREQLLASSSREPTVEQIAEAIGLPREEVVLSLEAIAQPVSLYEPVYSDGGDALYVMDQVSTPSDTDENWLDEILLRDALADLTEREKKILSLRFFAGKTQMEVSEEIGISQAQVSRLEKTAIAKVKRFL